MRPDQREKLDELSEQLTDVVLDEANPANWPGAGLAPEDIDAKTGAQRYYAKKQASTTVTILTKVVALRVVAARLAADDPADPVALDQMIQTARNEVTAVLDRVRARRIGEAPPRRGPPVERPRGNDGPDLSDLPRQ